MTSPQKQIGRETSSGIAADLFVRWRRGASEPHDEIARGERQHAEHMAEP
jgi:hypothetical protein